MPAYHYPMLRDRVIGHYAHTLSFRVALQQLGHFFERWFRLRLDAGFGDHYKRRLH